MTRTVTRPLSLAAALAALVCVSAPPAQAAPEHAAAACASGYLPRYVDSNVDFAKVHRNPGTQSTDVVGQLPSGARFCFNQTTPYKIDGHYWNKGYGYNGTAKLSGWVAEGLTHA